MTVEDCTRQPPSTDAIRIVVEWYIYTSVVLTHMKEDERALRIATAEAQRPSECLSGSDANSSSEDGHLRGRRAPTERQRGFTPGGEAQQLLSLGQRESDDDDESGDHRIWGRSIGRVNMAKRPKTPRCQPTEALGWWQAGTQP